MYLNIFLYLKEFDDLINKKNLLLDILFIIIK